MVANILTRKESEIMQNFVYHNPVKIVFGKGSIAQLTDLLPQNAKILMAYGGGSIKKNGVYDQVMTALSGRAVTEFSGIEPNPKYETLMRAVEIVKKEKIDFILAVGGGSVLDGVKFIAAAAVYAEGIDPWQMLVDHGASIKASLPVGAVLTLPATGSEMNGNAVVSRLSTQEKLAFGTPIALPQFSILDPETTYSLPTRQTINGIVDAYIHTLEQYMTYPADAPLQDRQAEAILQTLVEEGPKALERPTDYNVRANLMWSATQALNGLIGCGVPQDWVTHMIGHEMTALYGLDHAVTLAIVMPAVMRYKAKEKREKLLQYGERVFGISKGDDDSRVLAAIEKTEEFFRSLGMKTRLVEHGITTDLEQIGIQREKHGLPLGERGDIFRKDIDNIIALCRE
jgi:NADP-dependent alcohol dehydrogenase